MIVGAADIGATNCGLCLWNGVFRVLSVTLPGAEDDEENYALEARRLGEFRDFFWGWLVAEKIEALAVELPLRSDVGRRNEDDTWAPATSMSTVFRTYNNVGAAIEIAHRLNIKTEMVAVGRWRGAFLGVHRAPPTVRPKDRRAWWKARVREELARLGIETHNNDQGDAAGLCWFFRQKLRLEGVGARSDDLFARRIA